MLTIDSLGYAAGLLTTFSMVPQIARVYKLKSAREISFIFSSALLVGMLCWLVYGAILGVIPLIIWNALGACMACLLLISKWKWGR